MNPNCERCPHIRKLRAQEAEMSIKPKMGPDGHFYNALAEPLPGYEQAKDSLKKAKEETAECSGAISYIIKSKSEVYGRAVITSQTIVYQCGLPEKG